MDAFITWGRTHAGFIAGLLIGLQVGAFLISASR